MMRSISLAASLLLATIAVPFVAQDSPLARVQLQQRSNVAETGPAQPGGIVTSLLSSTSAQRKLDNEIAKAARDMRQAESDDARDDAETTLRKLLGKDYDSRLEGYEEELKQLEKTIATMRKTLTRRRDAKGEMIDLRVKVLEAEAQDLGWPVRRRRSSSFRNLTGPGSRTLWSEPARQRGGR